MIGIYFSGTGNSKYCVETFLGRYSFAAQAVSIEEPHAVQLLQAQEELVIGFPVQYSNMPKILRDFVVTNCSIWRGKQVFVIATMGLFSGDGAGILARLLRKYGAVITGGLHLKMPDSICDERVLKRSLRANQQLIKNAERKINAAVEGYQKGKPPQDGLSIFCHIAGLLGQRLYFNNKMKNYSANLKIDTDRCVGCGRCISLCPMRNIDMDAENNCAKSSNKCTMCYRCISQCPTQAITLLGRQVIEQCYIEKYLP